MKNTFLLLLFGIIISPIYTCAQTSQNGTLELNDGRKISGIITKYSQENGYSYTFYRVDSNESTIYVSETEIMSLDAGKRIQIKSPKNMHVLKNNEIKNNRKAIIGACIGIICGPPGIVAGYFIGRSMDKKSDSEGENQIRIKKTKSSNNIKSSTERLDKIKQTKISKKDKKQLLIFGE